MENSEILDRDSLKAKILEPLEGNSPAKTYVQGSLICYEIISEQIYCLGEKEAETREELKQLKTDITQMKLSLNVCATLLLKICDRLQISNDTGTGEHSTTADPAALKIDQQQQTLSNQLKTSKRPSNNTNAMKFGPTKTIDSTNNEMPINWIYSTPSASNQAIQQPAALKEARQQQQTWSNQMNTSERPLNNMNAMNFGPMNKTIDLTNNEMPINWIYSTPNASNQALQQMNVIDSNFSQFNNKRKRTESESITPSTTTYPPDNDELVAIGPNRTTISAALLNNIDWQSHTVATRQLLRHKFSREMLATHTLSGKSWPNYTANKEQLDPYITSDIIDYVSRRCNICPQYVKNAISAKCGEEYRNMRLRMEKENVKKINA